MLAFIFNQSGETLIGTAEDDDEFNRVEPGNVVFHGIIKDWDAAKTLAERANKLADGYDYLAIDNGPQTHPRFDVIRAPQIGDACSYGFNGDFYPDGVIAKIGGMNHRIITSSTGQRYFRQGESMRWIRQGGTFALCSGRVERRNQEI